LADVAHIAVPTVALLRAVEDAVATAIHPALIAAAAVARIAVRWPVVAFFIARDDAVATEQDLCSAVQTSSGGG
jgi:hypothetical protein